MDHLNNTPQLDIPSILSHTSIFSGIGFHELHLLTSKCVLRSYNSEEIVIEQGEVGDTLYIIIKGRVTVSVNTRSQGMMRVDTLGSGDVFGEIAILRNIPRTARITTETPCTFLTITAKSFLEMYQYFPPESRNNIQLIVAKRLALNPS